MQLVHLRPQVRDRIVGDVATQAVRDDHDPLVAEFAITHSRRVQASQEFEDAGSDVAADGIGARAGIEIADDVNEAGCQPAGQNVGD